MKNQIIAGLISIIASFLIMMFLLADIHIITWDGSKRAAIVLIAICIYVISQIFINNEN